MGFSPLVNENYKKHTIMGDIADYELSCWEGDDYWGCEHDRTPVRLGRVHTTKDRQEIPIMEMEDSHLNNTILLILRRASSKRNRADQQASRKTDNKFQATLRGVKEIDVEDLAEQINRDVLLVGIYITDAVRRGMDCSEYTKVLSQIYAE